MTCNLFSLLHEHNNDSLGSDQIPSFLPFPKTIVMWFLFNSLFFLKRIRLEKMKRFTKKQTRKAYKTDRSNRMKNKVRYIRK